MQETILIIAIIGILCFISFIIGRYMGYKEGLSYMERISRQAMKDLTEDFLRQFNEYKRRINK